MASKTEAGTYPVEKTEAEWRQQLNGNQFAVLRQHATERPWSSPLDHEFSGGTYFCAGCGNELFTSDTKFDSGCGWPSFFEAKEGAIATTVDHSHGMTRTEVHCANCGGHLGHVFPDGPRPTGERYCMNGVALKFVKKDG